MRRISKGVLWILLAMALHGQEQPAQSSPKTWKDQAEYDLYSAAAKETDPKKKISVLDTWKEKYSQTDYKQERLVLYLRTYEQLADLHKMVDILNQLLGLNPQDVEVPKAIQLLILSPQYNDTSAAALDNAEKAANSALSNLDKKPAKVNDADWANARKGLEALSHMTLGWVAMNRKNSEAAEQEFVRSLKVDPNAAQVDYWLGTVLRAQKSPEKISQALFFHARAVTEEGVEALPAQFRKQVDDYLHKSYNAYHGQDEKGLNELKNLAKSQPFPPEGFKVRTANEIAAEKEEEFRKTNPQLALWTTLKKELTGPNGTQYFENSMKGADVPGGAGGVSVFKGTLISAKPALRPKELIVGIADANTPEVTIKLDTPLPGKPPIGTELEFGGIAESFIPDPFMVTFRVERSSIKGLKAPMSH
jgi:tetratricopeptide (TPR) repeat protein